MIVDGLSGEIPAELGNLSNLIVLNLQDNGLSGEIPAELGNLSNLETLLLYDNTSLMGALPQSLTGLTKLTHFYFNNTGLCATLDPAFQTWLQGIEETSGSNCEIAPVLSVCDRTPAVRDAIMGLVPVSACGDVTGEHLSTINTLHLNGASLTELKADDLSGLTGLIELNLQDNQLSSLPDGFFDDLTALSWLDLGFNQLTSIPSELFTLSNLSSLIFWDNQLSGKIPKELGNLSNLRTLTLSNNQLVGEIPTELGNLSNLEGLWLEDNASLIGALPQSLTGLTKLTHFYFNNTGLCAPLDPAFQTWLQGIANASGSNCTLRLSVCDRTPAVRDAIMGLVPMSACGDVTEEHLSTINKFNLSGASLTELKADDLSDLTGLENLILSKNQLSSLPDGFCDDLTALTRLDMSDNQLTSIPSELFTLPNMKQLLLHSNQLSGEIPTELGNLSNLTALTLNNNQLVGEIPTELGNLSKLEGLLLHDNTSLMGALPQSLTGLTKLLVFHFFNTGLCAPLDPAFQTWLQGIGNAAGSNCSE